MRIGRSLDAGGKGMPTAMRRCRVIATRACGAALLAAVAACGAGRWPDPPPVDGSTYDTEYREWLDERRAIALEAQRLVGVWPLPDGDTAFGSDTSGPIVLPASAAPLKAGTFRRAAEKIMVIPASGVPLRWEDGRSITDAVEMRDVVTLGSLHLMIEEVGEGFSGRRFVTASDENRVDARTMAAINTYPIDLECRVAARFEAFDSPRSIQVGDVRGGVQYFVAPGQLVFRLRHDELRLTALTGPAGQDFFVMFKDATNFSTTYAGYRMLFAARVESGGWTVLDFNRASNPPCAYSAYTLCPLPPPENRLAIAVEAGEQRFQPRAGSKP